MADTEQDRLVVARIGRTARPYTQCLSLHDSERRQAIAKLRQAACGRTDLLAEYAGLADAFYDRDQPGVGHSPATQLCIDSGVDISLIREWAAEGRRRGAQLQDTFLDKKDGGRNTFHEPPLVGAFWKAEGCPGRLYNEFPVGQNISGEQSCRYIDNLVVLNEPFGIALPGEGRVTSLKGKDVIIIQAKESRLNPSLFGQALLSIDLINQMKPRSVRSVAVCVEDDPDVRIDHPISAPEEPVLEVCVVRPHCTYRNSKVPRWPGSWTCLGITDEAKTEPRLSDHVRVPGVLIQGVSSGDGRIDARLVEGKDVISIHSFDGSLGMWVSGEVIIAQELLRKQCPASTRSLIRCRRGDKAVEDALRLHVTVEASIRIGDFHQLWIRQTDSEMIEWPPGIAI